MAEDNPVLESGSAAGEPSQTMIEIGDLLARNANSEIGNWNNAAEIRVVALENVIIERLAKLAKLYAAGPPEKELKALKDRLAAISKEVEAQDQGAALVPSGSTSEQARPGNPTREEDVGRDAFDQSSERAQDGPQLYAAGPPEKELKSLKDRLAAISKELEAQDQGAALVPSGSTSEQTRPGNLTREEAVGLDASDQWIERAQNEPPFSARIRAIEASIRVSAGPSHYRNENKDKFASNWSSIARSGLRPFAYLIIAALLGVGARVAWHYGGHEAKEMAKTWSSSLGWPSFASKKNTLPAPVKAAVATRPEVAPRVDPIRPGSAARRDSSGQPGAKKDLTAQSAPAPTRRIEQDNKPKKISPPLDRSKVIPTPEARPTTIEGWTVHEVSDGVAVLEGPNGIWRAKRGDEVPGVGRVESIVRWGSYWLVATSKGLISTP